MPIPVTYQQNGFGEGVGSAGRQDPHPVCWLQRGILRSELRSYLPKSWSGARRGDPLEDMCVGMSHAGSWREEDPRRERRSASSPPGRACSRGKLGTGTCGGFSSVRGGRGGAARVGRKVRDARGVEEVRASGSLSTEELPGEALGVGKAVQGAAGPPGVRASGTFRAPARLPISVPHRPPSIPPEFGFLSFTRASVLKTLKIKFRTASS